MSPVQRISRFRHARHLRETRGPQPNFWKRYKLRRHATDLLLFLCLVAIFYVALKYFARIP
jgi:hypothetical protein